MSIYSDIHRMAYYYSFSFNPKKKFLLRNTELLKKKNSDKAYVLATGPSIKNLDLTKLEGQDCYSVSNFFLHKDIGIIKPKLHFFAPYHPPLILDNFVEWLKMADDMLPIETDIVLALSNKYIKEDFKLFSKRNVYYLDFVSCDTPRTDITRPVTAPQTGPLMIFPVLDYLGYSMINLVGCDMNVLKNYGEKIENFYEHDPRKSATDKSSWCDGIIYNLECTLHTMKMFEMYDCYFQKHNKKMFNLSKDSWLDFIEYKAIEDTLN